MRIVTKTAYSLMGIVESHKHDFLLQAALYFWKHHVTCTAVSGLGSIPASGVTSG